MEVLVSNSLVMKERLEGQRRARQEGFGGLSPGKFLQTTTLKPWENA